MIITLKQKHSRTNVISLRYFFGLNYFNELAGKYSYSNNVPTNSYGSGSTRSMESNNPKKSLPPTKQKSTQWKKKGGKGK